jgi:UDP-N-acetylmuramoylalanine--D-glutamate ligase
MRAQSFNGQEVVVLGLGRSGLSAAKALKEGGAIVHAWDNAETARKVALEQGIALTKPEGLNWSKVAGLILSPGVPLHFPAPHPLAALARAAHVPIIGDVELMLRERLAARLVGVTGTNGKSTTTALIGHVLQSAGVPAATGGNLGTPALELGPLPASGVYVLEMSSFQLELAPSWRADVAVLLNIAPDHLDRHGTMENYIAAKRRIFAAQKEEGVAVVGVDDQFCLRLYEELRGQGRRTIAVTLQGAPKPDQITVRGGVLFEGEREIGPLRLPRLLGRHNWQNAGAAYATARALGIDPPAITAALASFPGLAHRIERLGRIRGVEFVNDSKATNAAAAAKALACFDAIYWIAGGRAKSDGIEPLAAFFPRIRHAYLIGEAAERFAQTLESVPHSIVGTLDKAVAAAFRQAVADGALKPVVLLSPACASFDQFRDFEERGERFRGYVRELSGSSGAKTRAKNPGGKAA